MPESHEPCNERGHENGQNAEIQKVPGFWDVLPDVLRPNVFTPFPDFTCGKTPHVYSMTPEMDNTSKNVGKVRQYLFFFSSFYAWPMTQDMMRISIQVNGVVFIRKSCDGWSWMVMFGSSDVPPKRSTALRTSRQRNMTKEAAWATNFRKGPHISFPSWQQRGRAGGGWKWIDFALLKMSVFYLFYAEAWGCSNLIWSLEGGRPPLTLLISRFTNIFYHLQFKPLWGYS